MRRVSFGIPPHGTSQGAPSLGQDFNRIKEEPIGEAEGIFAGGDPAAKKASLAKPV
jgi:hypothetical protein